MGEGLDAGPAAAEHRTYVWRQYRRWHARCSCGWVWFATSDARPRAQAAARAHRKDAREAAVRADKSEPQIDVTDAAVQPAEHSETLH